MRELDESPRFSSVGFQCFVLHLVFIFTWRKVWPGCSGETALSSEAPSSSVVTSAARFAGLASPNKMASDVRNVSTRVLQCGIEGDLPEKHDVSIAILGARVHEEGSRNTDFDEADELFFGSARELSSCFIGKMTPVTADEGDREAQRGHVSPRRSPRNSRSKSDSVAKMSEVASNGGNANPTVKRAMENVTGLCNGHRDEQPSKDLMEDAKIGLSPKTKGDLKLNGTSPPCANQCMSLIKSAGSPAEIVVSSSCGKTCHVADSSHGNRTPCSNGIASSVVRAICFEETDVRPEECQDGEDMALVTSSDDVSTEKSDLEESPQSEKTHIPDPDRREGEANASDVSYETEKQEGSNKRKGKKRSSGDDAIPVVPRKRRMASITAELKVNLMYEKDDWKPPKKTRKGKSLSSSSSDGEVFTTSPTDSSKLNTFGNGEENGGFPTDPDQPLDLSMKKRPIAVAKKVKSKTKLLGTTSGKKQKSRSKSFPPQKGGGSEKVCGHTKRMAALNAQAIMTAYKTADDASQTKKNNRGRSKSGGGSAKNGYKRHQHAANFRLLCGGFNRNRTSLLASSGLPSMHARPPGMGSPVPSHPQTLMLTGLANLSASQILPNGGISPTTTESAFSKFSSARLHNGVWYQTAGPFHQPLHTVLSDQVGPSTDRKSDPFPALDTAQTHNHKFVARTKRKKSTNGWKWQGEPYEKMVFSAAQGKPVRRLCYRGMCREDDLIQERDTVLLKSGPRKKDLPFVAKVTALWEDQEDGEMMMSLLWYYRPEHIEGGKRPQHGECELFAARHPDENSVACIEDKCYVLTYSEFCRFRRQLKVRGEVLGSLNTVVPLDEVDFSAFLPPHRRLPDNVDPESVYFCRRVYDFRHGRMLKNPI
ncbi:PREDICTED: uncharacterized protein LOC109465763 [Branchiostoma belcheri]|uniref:Uncharacterized protein LOC109465763 n=1 Tax=Branchiostoma belcheri TaxID=7741 RepID=A0A6P4Y8Y3_BRABE|nr:PREDICTED: uncharacterized protein LOC109465763 [Branchiostoma belcheri]